MSCNILKSISNINATWEEVTSTCMNNVWPEYVHDFKAFEEVSNIAIQGAAIAQDLGLGSVEPDGVTELLESHCQPCINEKPEDLSAQLTQKQQQQEQDETDLRAIETVTCRKFWLGLVGPCRG
jgi:hypothetical protein